MVSGSSTESRGRSAGGPGEGQEGLLKGLFKGGRSGGGQEGQGSLKWALKRSRGRSGGVRKVKVRRGSLKGI